MSFVTGKLYRIMSSTCWTCKEGDYVDKPIGYHYFITTSSPIKGSIVLYTGKVIKQNHKAYFEFLYEGQIIYMTFAIDVFTGKSYTYGLKLL